MLVRQPLGHLLVEGDFVTQKIVSMLKSVTLIPHLFLAGVEFLVLGVLEAESVVLLAHFINDMVTKLHFLFQLLILHLLLGLL